MHLGALGDRHLGLRDGPIARQIDGHAAQKVQNADVFVPTLDRYTDEFVGTAPTIGVLCPTIPAAAFDELK